ncbi:MAG TPA: hypothetical protein VMF68_06845 [Spirochaetia bacterium]|nr:hypothetical protein [Spirochaetia bacterium]
MRQILRSVAVLVLLVAAAGLGLAQGKAGTLVCVGLYSETGDGNVSYKVGSGDWTVVKIGDTIPAAAQIRVNVDRDWIELTPGNNPAAVYVLHGPDSGELVKKVADILKGKPKLVSFPKPSGATPDPRFKDKLVVTQYLGRQQYVTADGDSRDIQYGDVLDITGKVRIIGINNTINLRNAAGKETQVIGPLNFTVEQVLKNEKLYKFLNTH